LNHSIAIEFSRLSFIQLSALLDDSKTAKTICSNQNRLNWVSTERVITKLGITQGTGVCLL